MFTTNDVHQQFAAFFKSEILQPYAYLVSRKLGEGHICLPLEDLNEEKETLPEHYKELLGKRHRLEDEPMIATQAGQRRPFVLFNDRLYLQRYFSYETRILERLLAFVQTEAVAFAERAGRLKELKELLASLFPPAQSDEPQTDWQMIAAITAFLNDFTIITGGPGTGKTTTVARILALLFHASPDLHVALAAPTGKAAARMAESLKKASSGLPEAIASKFQTLQPSTIHRLLGYVPDSSAFRHSAGNPLAFDVVVVDESSMIDAALFAKLLEAVGNGTRLILLGDKDQLASVEAGSLFGDLCQAQERLNIFDQHRALLFSELVNEPARGLKQEDVGPHSAHPLFQHVVELRYSHRFKGDQGIGKFSRAVIRGDAEAVRSFLTSKDEQVRLYTSKDSSFLEEFGEGYADYIAEQDIASALQKMNKLRVLCAVREGEQGLYLLNKKIENYLERKKLIRVNAPFYENRPVMVTANNYTAGLFNGDTGIVRTDSRGVLQVYFEDSENGLKAVLPGYISKSETVFAMTIHKSQGSEFDRVLVVLPEDEELPILTRELLYTGITRARMQVCLEATEPVILKASERLVKRASGIAERMSTHVHQINS